MRTLTILAVRATLVLALVAAVVDIPLPARTSARVRLHLIDRSDSVRRGPADAPRPEDADRIRAYDQDQKPPGDTILWASFGREIAFESTTVDGTETNLAGALEAALARNPTEIILHSDGRADPGRALLLCRARGVPVHVFPLGGAAVRDARIAAVSVKEASIDVTVISTFDVVLSVRLNDAARNLKLVANVPTLVSFPERRPGRFKVTLDVSDDCPENNEAEGFVQDPSGKKRVLAISADFPDLPAFDVRRSPGFVDPQGMDAVVLDNVPLSNEEQARLAAWVQGGRGLLLLGGKKSYALGGWKGTPIDDISPLRANPDQKVAVIFVMDCSGSMLGTLDTVKATVKVAWRTFEKGDYVAALTFPAGELIESESGINRPEPSGGTTIVEALVKARNRLLQVDAHGKQIFLLTDGETKETPESIRAIGRTLQEDQITLTVISVGKQLGIGDPVKIDDWKELQKSFNRLLPATREVFKEKPGLLVLHEHPATAGVPDHVLEWMNLTSAKQDAQVVGTVGKAPAIHAVAFRQAGRGRVGAFAFDRPHAKLLAQAIDHVAGPSSGGLRLMIDPPVVRARGSDPTPLRPTYTVLPAGQSGLIEFRQILSDAWEAPLPRTKPGTLWIDAGTAHATITIPCAPEFEALGIDGKALARIASETGGRVLRSPGELTGLPRPSAPAPRPGRPVFLVAGLVLIFLEMALTTFWKA